MIKLGVDFGGTKIEAAAIDPDGHFLLRRRVSTPGTYDEAVRAVADLIAEVENEIGKAESIGIGVPGSNDPKNGIMRNANAIYLNGMPFQSDLRRTLGRKVYLDNDANCFALSEVRDGAAMGAKVAFAIIIGTGCGAGLVIDGKVVQGSNGMTSEFGHVPLPWPRSSELPQPACWCGLTGCLERWISGSGFRDDFARRTGRRPHGNEIVKLARLGDPVAQAVLDDYLDRLARGMAMIVNILDPHCFVLGGGMSNIPEIYERVPLLIPNYTFGKVAEVRMSPAKWGDSSGVRGAAFLGES